jgi:hypothetical protein
MRWVGLSNRSWRFRAQFDRSVAEHAAQLAELSYVTEGDVTALPSPVQRYLRAVGVVGLPRVHNYRVRFRGRIRSSPDARWMPFEADQVSVSDPPTRLFLMHARMFGLPVQAFHQLIDGHAQMRVKALGLFQLVDARGDVMDRSETVTLFNDMCILAPSTLIDGAITWESVDATSVRARFRNGAQEIGATLFFDDDGLLTNFVSDDRSRASSDGKTFTRLRFSTPVRSYQHVRTFPASETMIRLPARGDARWLLPEGEFTYGDFDIRSVEYNVPA